MIAQTKDNGLAIDCKVETTPNGYQRVGNFHAEVLINNHNNELDQIEKQIEQIGRQIKRDLCRTTLETADERNVQLLQKTQSHLHKNGKIPFTIIATFGKIRLYRQRLRNATTGKTIIPSAILWQTSQNRHVTTQTIEAAFRAQYRISFL